MRITLEPFNSPIILRHVIPAPAFQRARLLVNPLTVPFDAVLTVVVFEHGAFDIDGRPNTHFGGATVVDLVAGRRALACDFLNNVTCIIVGAAGTAVTPSNLVGSGGFLHVLGVAGYERLGIGGGERSGRAERQENVENAYVHYEVPGECLVRFVSCGVVKFGSSMESFGRDAAECIWAHAQVFGAILPVDLAMGQCWMSPTCDAMPIH